MAETYFDFDSNMLHLHEMFRIVGDQLTERDVHLLKSMFGKVFSCEFLAQIEDGFGFLLALERAGRVDESNFRQVSELLRIIDRRDLLPFVTLRRRKTVKSDPVDEYLEECARASTVISFCRKRSADNSPGASQVDKSVPKVNSLCQKSKKFAGAAGPVPAETSHSVSHTPIASGNHSLCSSGCLSDQPTEGETSAAISNVKDDTAYSSSPTASTASNAGRSSEQLTCDTNTGACRPDEQNLPTDTCRSPTSQLQYNSGDENNFPAGSSLTPRSPWQQGEFSLGQSPQKRKKRSSFGRRRRKRARGLPPSPMSGPIVGDSRSLTSSVPISSVAAQTSPIQVEQPATGLSASGEIRKNVTCDIRLRVRAEYCHHDNALDGNIHSNKPELLERQFEKFMQANTILKSRDLGSIICDIKFSELTYLDAFWRDYINGSLLEALKGVFITESLKQAVGHEAIKLLVNVDEDDYDSGRLVLLNNLKE